MRLTGPYNSQSPNDSLEVLGLLALQMFTAQGSMGCCLRDVWFHNNPVPWIDTYVRCEPNAAVWLGLSSHQCQSTIIPRSSKVAVVWWGWLYSSCMWALLIEPANHVWVHAVCSALCTLGQMVCWPECMKRWMSDVPPSQGWGCVATGLFCEGRVTWDYCTWGSGVRRLLCRMWTLCLRLPI